MMIRILIIVLAVALTFAATPLAAQEFVGAGTAEDVQRTPSASSVPRPALDSRLVVQPVVTWNTARPEESQAWQDVSRPRWHYPAIGAAIGVAAGVIHANAITQGDYVGLPVEPMILLPIAYGAIGAFLGVLMDSAERERAARR